MPDVLLLNGPPGVGKTTVARLVAAQRPGTVVIHGDDLREFAPQDARAHLGPGSTYRAGGALAATYLAMGAPLVVFEYCFLKPENIDCVRPALPPGTPLHVVTLWAPLATCEARAAGRPGREPLGPAIAECHALIEAHRDDLGIPVDASDGTPEAVAGRVDLSIASR